MFQGSWSLWMISVTIVVTMFCAQASSRIGSPKVKRRPIGRRRLCAALSAAKRPFGRDSVRTKDLDPAGLARGIDDHGRMGTIKSVGLLVPISFTHCCASTLGLSTWWSSTALIGSTRFQVGFPLRCLQRLSRPYIATLHCGWRHNRSTRGTSIPVLSY